MLRDSGRAAPGGSHHPEQGICRPIGPGPSEFSWCESLQRSKLRPQTIIISPLPNHHASDFSCASQKMASDAWLVQAITTVMVSRPPSGGATGTSDGNISFDAAQRDIGRLLLNESGSPRWISHSDTASCLGLLLPSPGLRLYDCQIHLTLAVLPDSGFFLQLSFSPLGVRGGKS